MSEEIKPCPFCEGDPAPLDENDHTSCTNVACGSTAYMHVDAWNNRPSMRAYARIEELEAELGGWLPIETAPKDGTEIDLWHEEFGRYSDCHWGLPEHCCGEYGRYCDSDWHSMKEGWIMSILNELLDADSFTHWMPLPSPPISTTNTTLDEQERGDAA